MPIMSYEDSIKVIDSINTVIKSTGIDTNKISDGYHTFGELYDHRITLYIKLCEMIVSHREYISVWKSKLHHDGTSFDGWFILGLEIQKGKQVSYHIPVAKWDECPFATEFDKAPEWDGHTSNDVLERLKQL